MVVSFTSLALAGLFFLGATDALEPKRLDLLRELLRGIRLMAYC